MTGRQAGRQADTETESLMSSRQEKVTRVGYITHHVERKPREIKHTEGEKARKGMGEGGGRKKKRKKRRKKNPFSCAY